MRLIYMDDTMDNLNYVYGYKEPCEIAWIHSLYLMQEFCKTITDPIADVIKEYGQKLERIEEIKSPQDFIRLDIEESFQIEVNGFSTVFKGVPMLLRTYASSDLVELLVPKAYVDSVTRYDRPLTFEEKKNLFDGFMDILDFNTNFFCGRYLGFVKASKEIVREITSNKTFDEQRIYRDDIEIPGMSIDITKVCNDVVKNYKNSKKEQ